MDFLGDCPVMRLVLGTPLAGISLQLSINDVMFVNQESSMNSVFSVGALIPLWILGAGLILGVIQWFSTPNPASRD